MELLLGLGTANGLIHGLLIDSSGNVLLSEILDGTGNSRITKFDSAGAVLSTITSGLSFAGQLVLDSANNLYASNASGGVISKYNSSGVYQGTFATGSGGAGSNDYGLAYDPVSNNFFQATFGPNTTNNPVGAIQRFDASGNSLGYLAIGQNTAYFLATIPQAPVAATVPEPSSIIWASVLGLLGIRARRRARNSAESKSE